MIPGIENTNKVKKIIGERLKSARTKVKLSRQAAVDKLNKSNKAPHFENRKPLSLDVYKKWEYGDNTIEIEWLPAICDLYSCDYGYLFGEYQEKDRDTAFIVNKTGLSEDAVTRLQQINETNPLGQGIIRNNVMVPILGIISEFIEADALFQITNNVGFYLLYRELSKEPISATTEEEYEIAHSYTQKIGSEIISRKDLCEMYLQAAADYFKEMVKAIPIETERD